MGKDGPELAPLGLGCWAMIKGVYGSPSEDEPIATIHRALDLGFAHLDTADVTITVITRNWSARPSRDGATRSSSTRKSACS